MEFCQEYVFLIVTNKDFIEPFNFSFFSITGRGIGLDYLILNGLPWKRTEIILSFLRLHTSTAFQTLVDYHGYSISSKGFLPTVVDIMIYTSFGLGIQNEAGQRLIEFCQENTLVIANTLFQQHKRRV